MKYIKSIMMTIATFALIFINASTAYANPQTEAPATDVPAITDDAEAENSDNVTEPPVSSEVPADNDDAQVTENQQPDEPEANEPVVDTVPTKLKIHLGSHWAKSEFELSTDAGPYPEAITVDDKGDLYLDIPDDGDIQLSVLYRSVVPPVPTNAVSEPENSPIPVVTDGAPVELEEAAANGVGIPTLHIVLFAGGSVLCIGFLIFFFVRRRRNNAYDEYDEEYEDE